MSRAAMSARRLVTGSVILLAPALAFAVGGPDDGRKRPAGGDAGARLREVWSQPDHGIVCSLGTDKAKYREGEPVLVRFTLKNVNARPVVLYAPRDPVAPLSPLGPLLDSDAVSVWFRRADKPAPPTLVTLEPDATHGLTFALGPAADRQSVTGFDYKLHAGFPVQSSDSLQPGVYRLQAQYFGKCYGAAAEIEARNRLLLEKGCWIGTLTAPPATFAVLPKLPDKPAEWGAAVGPLRCRLELDKRTYRVGQAVRMTRTVLNDGDEPKEIYGFRYLNDSLRLHWVDVESGRRRTFGDGKSSGGGIAPVPQSKPLTERLTDAMLTREPGRYQVFISCAVPGSHQRLVSNAQSITVERDPGCGE